MDMDVDFDENKKNQNKIDNIQNLISNQQSFKSSRQKASAKENVADRQRGMMNDDFSDVLQALKDCPVIRMENDQFKSAVNSRPVKKLKRENFVDSSLSNPNEQLFRTNFEGGSGECDIEQTDEYVPPPLPATRAKISDNINNNNNNNNSISIFSGSTSVITERATIKNPEDISRNASRVTKPIQTAASFFSGIKRSRINSSTNSNTNTVSSIIKQPSTTTNSSETVNININQSTLQSIRMITPSESQIQVDEENKDSSKNEFWYTFNKRAKECAVNSFKMPFKLYVPTKEDIERALSKFSRYFIEDTYQDKDDPPYDFQGYYNPNKEYCFNDVVSHKCNKTNRYALWLTETPIEEPHKGNEPHKGSTFWKCIKECKVYRKNPPTKEEEYELAMGEQNGEAWYKGREGQEGASRNGMLCNKSHYYPNESNKIAWMVDTCRLLPRPQKLSQKKFAIAGHSLEHEPSDILSELFHFKVETFGIFMDPNYIDAHASVDTIITYEDGIYLNKFTRFDSRINVGEVKCTSFKPIRTNKPTKGGAINNTVSDYCLQKNGQGFTFKPLLGSNCTELLAYWKHKRWDPAKFLGDGKFLVGKILFSRQYLNQKMWELQKKAISAHKNCVETDTEPLNLDKNPIKFPKFEFLPLADVEIYLTVPKDEDGMYIYGPENDSQGLPMLDYDELTGIQGELSMNVTQFWDEPKQLLDVDEVNHR